MQERLLDTFSNGQALRNVSDSASAIAKTDSVLPILPTAELGAAQRLEPALNTITAEQTLPETKRFEELIGPAPQIENPKRVWRLRPRQMWEGTVVEIANGGFVARITDMTNPENPDEQATFELSEVSPEDRDLIRPGSSFYWTVGTERSPAGQVRNVTMVQFRRLPRYTNSSVQRATKRANEILSIFEPE